MFRMICVLFILFPFPGNAQRPAGSPNTGNSISGSLSGTLLDSITRNPVEYASVGVMEVSSGKIINGGITDERGFFRIGELPLAEYQVQISFIGYKLKTVEAVILTPKRPDVEVGTIILSPESQILDEIKIVGEAALIEFKPDKIVYNAERDVTSAGGDASDVLRKVPLLTVDFDGNVTMRGSENVKILINGRPSGMFSTNVADALKMMPADQIKSVEVITSPTAKYDAEGTSGIINIITRKKNIEGLAGSVDLTAGTRTDRLNGNLNYGKGRLGINVSGGGHYNTPQDGLSSFRRDDYSDTSVSHLVQDGTNTSSRLGFRVNTGLEYNINAFNSINSSINIRGFDSQNDNHVQSIYTLDNSLYDSYQRNVDGSTGRAGVEWDMEYKKTFAKEGKEWTISAQYDNDDNKSDFDYTQTYHFPADQPMTLENNANKNDNLEVTLQTDYVHPLNEQITIETGLKSTLRKLVSDFQYNSFDSDLNEWETVPERTDAFRYHQNVYAGYGSASLKLGERMNLIGGARLEVTDLNGEFDIFQVPFSNTYTNFLPSITLSRKIGQANQLKISYNQRIQRPSQRHINPFVEYNDNRDISYGNPYLFPELVHQLELGSTFFIKGNMINASVFGRKTEHLIESILTINDEGVSETTYYNFGNRSSLGINIFGSLNMGEKLTLRGGFDVNAWETDGILGTVTLNNSGYDYSGRLNLTWSISETMKVEGFTFFRSPSYTVQGKTPSWSMMSFGIKKELFNKKFAVGINFTEPFRENQVFIKELEGYNFYQYNETSRPVRSFGLILSYRFGKLDFKERTGRKKENNSDLKQDDSGPGDN